MLLKIGSKYFMRPLQLTLVAINIWHIDLSVFPRTGTAGVFCRKLHIPKRRILFLLKIDSKRISRQLRAKLVVTFIATDDCWAQQFSNCYAISSKEKRQWNFPLEASTSKIGRFFASYYSIEIFPAPVTRKISWHLHQN